MFTPKSDSRDVWEPPAYEEVAYTAPAPISEPHDTPLAFLAEFDTVFLIDDSSSMRGQRWKQTEEALAAIAPTCTQWDSDGIDIYFLNHDNPVDSQGAYRNVRTTEDVKRIFSSVYPRGGTWVGRRLEHILLPYIHNVREMQSWKRVHGSNSRFASRSSIKPVNVIVITDGLFTDDAEDTIKSFAVALDQMDPPAPGHQVGIQFFQMGDDVNVMKYLQELDDNLGRSSQDEKFRDIVDTVPWKGDGYKLDDKVIWKVVLGAVNKRYDRQKVEV